MGRVEPQKSSAGGRGGSASLREEVKAYHEVLTSPSSWQHAVLSHLPTAPDLILLPEPLRRATGYSTAGGILRNLSSLPQLEWDPTNMFAYGDM